MSTLKLSIRVGQALKQLQDAGVSKADLVRLASGQHIAGELHEQSEMIIDYCRYNDERLEAVVNGILNGYEVLTVEDYVGRFSKLTDLALKVNFETSHAVFISFSGHVGDFEIHIAKGKTNKEYNENIYKTRSLKPDDLFTPQYDEVVQRLSEFLHND